LRGQLDDASQSVAALIAEGFPLKTDRHFADYLYRAKGSSSETRAHLHAARVRECITLDEEQRLRSEYIEIEKMLAGLISYLRGSDWMDRW
jgi:four helix bundle protein